MATKTERRAIVRMDLGWGIKESIYPEKLARQIYFHGCHAHGREAMAIIILND